MTKEITNLNVAYPIGCLHDIPNGEFVQTEKGNWALLGGVRDVSCLAGTDASLSSAITKMKLTALLEHVPSSVGFCFNGVGGWAEEKIKGLTVTNGEFLSGSEWIRWVKAATANASKVHTPFGNLRILPISPIVIDSIDELNLKDFPPESMDSFQFRTQLVKQLPVLALEYGFKALITAIVRSHFGCPDFNPGTLDLNRDQSVSPAVLPFVCNSFTAVGREKELKHHPRPEKPPMFPKADGSEENEKLVLVHTKETRSMNAPSGHDINYVISPAEGVKKGLTELMFIRHGWNNTGIGGNPRHFFFELYPELKVSRKTIRSTLDNNLRLRNAVRLTAELIQMADSGSVYWDVICSHKTLHDDIEAMGYDWNILLDTRYWWSFKEDEGKQTKNELTIMDLLKMRLGEYHPYWLEDDNVTIKAEYVRK